MVRIHFVGGGTLEVDWSMDDVGARISDGGWSQHSPEGVLIVWDQVTHAEEFQPRSRQVQAY
jgi:hypothetical protein